MFAMRANTCICFQFLPVNHLLTTLALDPNIFGHTLAHERLDTRFELVKPVHKRSPYSDNKLKYKMFWHFLQEQIQNWRFGNQFYQDRTPIVSIRCPKWPLFSITSFSIDIVSILLYICPPNLYPLTILYPLILLTMEKAPC